MFVTGWVLALCGFIYAGLNIVVGERGRRLKMAKIKDGLKLKLAQTTVNLKTGKIQDASGLDRDTAVVLPVNTAFIDNCIRDKNSATGAYILEFYADKVSAIPEIMSKQLEKFGHRKNENGTYAPGTTILLPSPYDTPAKVLMTASTIKKEKIGIISSPTNICECIRNCFELTADKKISKFRMPILGSGHGGLDINDALLILMLTINYYSRIHHHIKQIDLVAVESDIEKLKEASIQYFMEEKGK
jgi:hypothetical protein